MHRTTSPRASPRLYPAVCKALCPRGCSFRRGEQRPGSPGAAHGQSAPARAAECGERVSAGCGHMRDPGSEQGQPELRKGLSSACTPRAGRRAEPGRLRWTRGTRASAQINHKALRERSRSPPRRAAICLCCSPAPARCGGAGAEDGEGARSPVALPSQQGGGDTSCGTGCREGPARTHLPAEPARDASPAAFVVHARPAAPSRGSAPARPLRARRSQARLSPSPRQRRARLGRGTGPRAPPRPG